MNIMQNPWAGLASYEDPEKAERKLKFCGRDDDSYDVTKLIMGNTFVTLYGKSGIGKTSLLNAGVFPELREEQYTPLSLRLGMRDESSPQSYQAIIIEAVERTVNRLETVDVIPLQDNQQSVDYLWKYFAGHRFYDKDDHPTTPVVVLDQFEEVFRSHRDEAEMLLRQLDNCTVNGQSRRYETNIRFVVSIREDDLYRLEDSIDNCYLTALKRCRYRLRSLSEQGARDAILIPGEGLFKAEEQNDIVDTIIRIARNKEDQSISTNLLSLVCSRIFVDYQKSGADHITPSLVDSFIKGNPFERFYNEATRGFSNREKSYIEDHLVDSTGRRNSIPESDFLLHVKNGAKLLEGDARILQRISTSSDGGNYRIELIHDSFCEPLSVQKETREKRKRLRQMTFFAIITIISLGIIALVTYQVHQVENANQLIVKSQLRIQESQSRLVSEKAMLLANEGDSYLARLLIMDVLPDNLESPNRPFVSEAEIAFRHSCSLNNATLWGHKEQVRYACFSPNDQRIISASGDSTIRVWDASTGQCLQILEGHSGGVNSASYSSDGQRIVSASSDNTIRIWDATTGRCIQTLDGHDCGVSSASFSPDGQLVVSASFDETIRVWNSYTGKCLHILKGHTFSVNSASFCPNNRRIVSSSSDNTVRVWDVETGLCLMTLKGHEDGVSSAFFSPDAKLIVSASWDGTIRIWDSESGQCLMVLKGPAGIVDYASFSPDGKFVLSAFSNNTIHVWDLSKGRIKQSLNGHTDRIHSLLFDSNGERFVSASKDKSIRIWDVSKNHPVQILKSYDKYPYNHVAATYSPDGKQIISASKDGDFRIWKVNSGQFVHAIDYHVSPYSFFDISHDGRQILLCSFDDRTIRIIDASTGQCLTTINNLGYYYGVARFTNDDKQIILVSDSIRYYSVSTGRCVKVIKKPNISFIYQSFSTDGKCVLMYEEKTINIVDFSFCNHLKQLKGHTDNICYASFSSDGKQVVSTSLDKTIRIWDAITGHCILTLYDNTSVSSFATISQDGKHVISVSGSIIRIWDAFTGLCLQSIEVDESEISPHSIALSPDARHFLSVFNDGTIQIWDFPPLQQLIDETRERFKDRQLTPEERRKYYLE